MPKKTFYNLAPSKREEILEKGMRLYVEYAYEDVTLQLVLDAFSWYPTTFYRYFDDKDELYLCIAKYLAEKYEKSANPAVDVFTVSSDMGPLSELEAAFNATLMKLPNDIMLRTYMECHKDRVFAQSKETLRRLRYEEKLRTDVDEDLISFMYATTFFNLFLYFKECRIDDPQLQSKLAEYFYTGFFLHGILKEEKRP